jgi:hypothetical protein
MEERTIEAQLLDRNPGVRELILSLPEFLAWRNALPVVELDGETFYVVGGDQLKDHDQVSVTWVNQFRPNLLKHRI